MDRITNSTLIIATVILSALAVTYIAYDDGPQPNEYGSIPIGMDRDIELTALLECDHLKHDGKHVWIYDKTEHEVEGIGLKIRYGDGVKVTADVHNDGQWERRTFSLYEMWNIETDRMFENIVIDATVYKHTDGTESYAQYPIKRYNPNTGEFEPYTRRSI